MSKKIPDANLEDWRSVAPKDKTWCDTIAPYMARVCEFSLDEMREVYRGDWCRLLRKPAFKALDPKAQLAAFKVEMEE